MTRDNKQFSASIDYEVGSPPPSGYVAWHEWAAAQGRGGLKQSQCPNCGLWLFPQELKGHNNVGGLPCSAEGKETKP